MQHAACNLEHFLEGLPYFHLIKGIPLRSERWISDRQEKVMSPFIKEGTFFAEAKQTDQEQIPMSRVVTDIPVPANYYCEQAPGPLNLSTCLVHQ